MNITLLIEIISYNQHTKEFSGTTQNFQFFRKDVFIHMNITLLIEIISYKSFNYVADDEKGKKNIAKLMSYRSGCSRCLEIRRAKLCYTKNA